MLFSILSLVALPFSSVSPCVCVFARSRSWKGSALEAATPAAHHQLSPAAADATLLKGVAEL